VVVREAAAMADGYLNKVELKDGQILLYHRTANSKRPIYHMRIHVRGMRDIHGNKLTYWKSTTNESDLEEAKRVALDKFDELRLLTKDNRPVVEISFADLYALWWKEKRLKLEASFAAKGRTGQTERVGWYEKQSKRYWLAYFGSKKISEINQAYVNGYWKWRIAYWTVASEQEKKKYPNFAIKPSKKTLDMEQSSLREIFGWGNANRIITYQPIIENPFARQGIAAKRRASFDEADWQQLREYMRRWVLGKGKNDKRVNSMHLYQRKLLQIYLHWLALTGMRTGEVLKLRHRHVVPGTTELYSDPILRIIVPDNTKTGKRGVSSQPQLIVWYETLIELTGRNAKGDWLFCDAQGKRNEGFFKSIPKLFEAAGVLLDADGGRRSAYSLRHYYAEQRLIELGTNARAFDIIGKNMGTGRQYLEDHYVRKGIMQDEDALVTAGGKVQYNRAVATEIAEAYIEVDTLNDLDD
jgi:integrase